MEIVLAALFGAAVGALLSWRLTVKRGVTPPSSPAPHVEPARTIQTEADSLRPA